MEVTYSNTQLFTIISFILWLYFVTLYVENRHTDNSFMLSLIQFGFSLPFSIVIALLSLSFNFGLICLALIPMLSIYFIVDASLYKRSQRK